MPNNIGLVWLRERQNEDSLVTKQKQISMRRLLIVSIVIPTIGMYTLEPNDIYIIEKTYQFSCFHICSEPIRNTS